MEHRDKIDYGTKLVNAWKLATKLYKSIYDRDEKSPSCCLWKWDPKPLYGCLGVYFGKFSGGGTKFGMARDVLFRVDDQPGLEQAWVMLDRDELKAAIPQDTVEAFKDIALPGLQCQFDHVEYCQDDIIRMQLQLSLPEH
ncbi:MAG: hypothetical protein SGARI_003198 [Bacillariaceae sp.]